MKELTEHILDYIIENREFPEELIYEFSKETIKLIQSRQTVAIPDIFWELENFVENFWRNGEFANIENPCIVYQMGQLLSFTNMISMMVDEEERGERLEDYAEQWYDRYLVFQCIHEKSGITHKALAEKTDTSVSALSQFINKVKWTGVFNCRVMGREKHYYLTEYGERLYECMKKKKEDDRQKEGGLSGSKYLYLPYYSNSALHKNRYEINNENMKDRIHKVENSEKNESDAKLTFSKLKYEKFNAMDNEERSICAVS